MSTKFLPASPSLEHLKKQAKDLYAALQANEPAAQARLQSLWPMRASTLSASISHGVSLSEAQLVIAREYGYASWPRLKRHVEQIAAQPQTMATEDSSAWDALQNALPSLAHLSAVERQAIPPIKTAQWYVTKVRWSEPDYEECALSTQEWIRLQPPVYAWRVIFDDNSWSHDVMDERGHMHTASSMDVCFHRPHLSPYTGVDLLRKVLFWPTENRESAGSSSLQRQRPESVWQREPVEVEGESLVRWHQETIEDNFHVSHAIWTDAMTARITRQERTETNLLTGKPACFIVYDRYVYNQEAPTGTFEMPPDKPIVNPNFKETMPEVWDTLSAKQKQTIQETIARSDLGWLNADFAVFSSVWDFDTVKLLPSEAEWKARIQQQANLWHTWISKIEIGNIQAYVPLTTATNTCTLIQVKYKILAVTATLQVTQGDGERTWYGLSEFFLRRTRHGYRIVHWDCPWKEILAAAGKIL